MHKRFNPKRAKPEIQQMNCDSKVPFDSRGEAQEVCDAYRKNHRRNMVHYRCPLCTKYHITTK